MGANKIRVGIIGAGGWAKYGHIPALQTLEEFEIAAVSSRKKATADETAAKFNIAHAFADEQALINHPDVDLVAIVAPAPEHARLVKAAIEARKDVYCEWPLSTRTADSEELLALAEAAGVRHIVGLQRRMGPSARYTRDLLKQGYAGKIRGVHMQSTWMLFRRRCHECTSGLFTPPTFRTSCRSMLRTLETCSIALSVFRRN